MKLTQKTLFQCFEKSRPKSPVVHSSPSKKTKILIQKKSESLFEFPINVISEQQESQTPQPDFLLPIHIRQLKSSLNPPISPLFNERKLNNDNSICFNQEFYRICPTIIHNQCHLPKLEVI